jgi:mono/diheme cytochrome c family protein
VIASYSRRLVVIVPALLAVGGCSWFSDFRDQPRIEPWEAEYAGNDTTPFRPGGSDSTFVAYSVPITGNTVPGYVVSYNGSVTSGPGAAPNPAVIDSMANVANPHAASRASLDNGRKHYQINCAVCHGVAGKGDGAAVRFGVPAPNLLGPVTKGRTDGYLYGMIRNGRGLMPNYVRIEDDDRWDVVNYLRALQGSVAGVVADTSPAGYPGENGQMVPGYTRTAPTRPAPYRPRDMDDRMHDPAASTATAAPAPAAAPPAAPAAAPAPAPAPAPAKPETHE